MSLPHPPSKDPAEWPRRANPNRADCAGVRHRVTATKTLPPSYPKASRQGAPRQGLDGCSRLSPELCRCSRFWFGVGALPRFPKTLSRPPKTAASCF